MPLKISPRETERLGEKFAALLLHDPRADPRTIPGLCERKSWQAAGEASRREAIRGIAYSARDILLRSGLRRDLVEQIIKPHTRY